MKFNFENSWEDFLGDIKEVKILRLEILNCSCKKETHVTRAIIF